MNIKTITVQSILAKLNFLKSIDDDTYTPLDEFTCNGDDDYDDFIAVDKAYIFKDTSLINKDGKIDIDVNRNYLQEIRNY